MAQFLSLGGRPLLRKFLAEFVSTLVLITLGDGAVAQSVLSREGKGTFLSVNIAWGLAVAFGIFVAGEVSGADMNPAISLATTIFRGKTVVELIVYTAAQMLGAFTGAAIVFGVYYEAITSFDGGERLIEGVNGTAGIFATYPQSFLNEYGGLADQIVGTALLTGLVFAITDSRNRQTPSYMIPILVGSVVTSIGLSYGYNCGYAINPARDLGPRLFTAVAGWGWEVVSYNNYHWFWIPILGPYIGSLLGALIYQMFIALHFPQIDKETIDDEPILLFSPVQNQTSCDTSSAVINRQLSETKF